MINPTMIDNIADALSPFEWKFSYKELQQLLQAYIQYVNGRSQCHFYVALEKHSDGNIEKHSFLQFLESLPLTK